MDFDLFARGLFAGLAIAVPIGPIGLLCIRRTLRDGPAAGIATGLGAATADAIYGAIAAFSLTAVVGWLGDWDTALRLAGAMSLVVIGIRVLSSEIAASPTEPSRGALLAAYATTVALTLANPTTIFSFLGIVAGIGLDGDSPVDAATVVAAVGIGSAGWWLVLTFAVSTLRGRVSLTGLRWVNRVAGCLLVGLGVAVAIPVLR